MELEVCLLSEKVMRIPGNTTAIIADCDANTRLSIRRLAGERIPNLNILAEAGNGKAALALLLKHTPDVAVLDLLMPLYTGKEVLDEIRRRNLKTRVLLMTACDSPDYLAPLFWRDALGYLYKGDGLDDWLVPALKAVILGRPFASPAPLEVLRNPGASSRPEPPGRLALNIGEMEMLRLTTRGKSDKEIAIALSIPVRTVEKRKARLRRKLGVGSTIELAVYAVTQRLLDSTDGHSLEIARYGTLGNNGAGH